MPFRKLSVTLTLLAFIVIFVAFAGRGMLKASSVYGDAQNEIERKFGVPRTDLTIPLLSAFNFSEGDSKGDAAFLICSSNEACYRVKASKGTHGWNIVSVDPK